jgi:hypothetical protein
MSKYTVTRKQLQQRHAQLLRRVGKIGGDLRSTHDRDSEERACELENDEVLEGLDFDRRGCQRLRRARTRAGLPRAAPPVRVDHADTRRGCGCALGGRSRQTGRGDPRRRGPTPRRLDRRRYARPERRPQAVPRIDDGQGLAHQRSSGACHTSLVFVSAARLARPVPGRARSRRRNDRGDGRRRPDRGGLRVTAARSTCPSGDRASSLAARQQGRLQPRASRPGAGVTATAVGAREPTDLRACAHRRSGRVDRGPRRRRARASADAAGQRQGWFPPAAARRDGVPCTVLRPGADSDLAGTVHAAEAPGTPTCPIASTGDGTLRG